jgi:hypothetical protein
MNYRRKERENTEEEEKKQENDGKTNRKFEGNSHARKK